MKTFQDLIDSGIAPMRVSSWGTSVPERDAFKEEYNNKWGYANDTHMDKIGPGYQENAKYFISGSAVADTKNFEVFRSVRSWRNMEFRVTLDEFLAENGMVGSYGVLNGQPVFVLYSVPEQIPEQ